MVSHSPGCTFRITRRSFQKLMLSPPLNENLRQSPGRYFLNDFTMQWGWGPLSQNWSCCEGLACSCLQRLWLPAWDRLPPGLSPTPRPPNWAPTDVLERKEMAKWDNVCVRSLLQTLDPASSAALGKLLNLSWPHFLCCRQMVITVPTWWGCDDCTIS